ncbi:MAG: hypothetical protein Q7S89_01275, partial [bacterium]|nr:hypothetical protein [bacterium]
MTADYFAYKQYLDYLVYQDLVSREKNPEFKIALSKLVSQELDDFKFWRQFTKQDPHVSRFSIWKFRMLRKILGLTFTARFLEGRERGMIKKYSAYLDGVKDANQRRQIEEIIKHERFHEG